MLLGPAFVAAIAYVDPGNVAANLTGGARYGYLLVWVVVLANAMAWLIQYLSAKLGVTTGESLPGRVILSPASLPESIADAQPEATPTLPGSLIEALGDDDD